METTTQHFSKFATLWIDSPDAEQEAARRLRDGTITDEQYRQLTKFIRDGYIVLKNAVDKKTIKKIVKLIDRTKKDPRYYVVGGPTPKFHYANHELRKGRTFRLPHLHVNSSAVRDAIFADPISEFIRLIFEQDILAFQTLTFVYGSQQGVHQDPAYVAVNSPTELVASWIALEDVKEGSGELMYFPGSHRMKEFLYADDRKHWLKSADGKESHREHTLYLHDQTKHHYKEERFLAKKGDVLIWHADLAHGGSEITNAKATRKSLVTHYCPNSVDPKYFEMEMHRTKLQHKEGCFYSSRHYNLSKPGPLRCPTTPKGQPPPARTSALRRLTKRLHGIR